MNKKLILSINIAIVLLCSCQNDDNSEKEKELIKKEIELISKEKELLSSQKAGITEDIKQNKNKDVVVNNTYTPEKGSKERQAIMDIFREDFGAEKEQILFRVEHLKICQSWACALVTPLKNNSDYAEPRWDLFNKINGRWQKVNWSNGINFQDDFELIDLPTQNGRIAKLIVKKYPSCSMSIFGN